jgi:hypothetical protein
MIDTLGPYLLILILGMRIDATAVAIHEMSSFESCRAALVQLEAVRELRGYCIAKELRE